MIIHSRVPVVLNSAFSPGLICASADCTISGTDASGNAVTGFPLSRGWNPDVFKLITAVSDSASLWVGYTNSPDGR